MNLLTYDLNLTAISRQDIEKEIDLEKETNKKLSDHENAIELHKENFIIE